MNERIKRLAEQAEIYAGELIDEGADYDQYPRYYTEKLAELIVRECAKFLEDNSGYDHANNAWHPEPEDMLKHFGVEE
jgi:hypothetical protein